MAQIAFDQNALRHTNLQHPKMRKAILPTIQRDIPTRFETERLFLRCYTPDDGQWYYHMIQKNRAHLIPYEADNVAMGLQSVEEAITLMTDMSAWWDTRQCLFAGVWEKATNSFVAQIYIGIVNRGLPEFEIGYFVDVDHEGQGFVTEAVKGALRFIFEHFQAHRVRLRCADTNIRSYQVAERCGFVREGHLRETKKGDDGTFHGTLCYGMLRREFKALGC